MSSVFFGIFFGKPYYLEFFGDPLIWTYLAIDSWELVMYPFVLFPLTLVVELVLYLVLVAHWGWEFGGSRVDLGDVVLSCLMVNIVSWPIISMLSWIISGISYSASYTSFTMFPVFFDVTVFLVVIVALYLFNRWGILREKS